MNQSDLVDAENSKSAYANVSHSMDWSPIAVRLLQGVIYHDDSDETWELLLRSVSPLSEYFAKIGLLLVVDEADGMAYLRQPDDDEIPADSPEIPRLFRRMPLSYEMTLLCVLLRDELLRFETDDVQNERCVVAQSDLLGVWQVFFPDQKDTVKLHRSLSVALHKLEDLKLVRQFEKEPASWEVRRIIKARLPLTDLERLRQSLMNEVANRLNTSGETSAEPQEES